MFAYASTGSGTFAGAALNYTWTEGSIGTMATTSTATTFDPLLNPLDNYLLGDLISEGCTGAHGYVASTFFMLIMKPEILFDRYLHPTENYN